MNYVAIYEHNDGFGVNFSLRPVNSVEEALKLNKAVIETDRNPYGDSYLLYFLIPSKKWDKAKIWINEVNELIKTHSKQITKTEIIPMGEPRNYISEQFRVRLSIGQWTGFSKDVLNGVVIEKGFY